MSALPVAACSLQPTFNILTEPSVCTLNPVGYNIALGYSSREQDTKTLKTQNKQI